MIVVLNEKILATNVQFPKVSSEYYALVASAYMAKKLGLESVKGKRGQEYTYLIAGIPQTRDHDK